MIIYTVTVFKHFDQSREDYGKNRQRTWGYYVTFEEAEKSIVNNWGDMFENNYYDMALIEKVPEGICICSEMIQWFKATFMPHVPGLYREPDVQRCDAPAWCASTVNWSMG